MHGGVDSEINGAVGSVVDGDKGGGGDDSILECLHGHSVGVISGESLILASEVGKQVHGSRVVADLDLHEAYGAKKGADISGQPAGWPVMYLSSLEVV